MLDKIELGGAEASAAPARTHAPAPRILSLATAVPRHLLRQSDVAAHASQLFGRTGGLIAKMLPIYRNAGIERRYSCVPIEWYLTPKSWHERAEIYVDSAIELLAQAAETCLGQAGLDAATVDTLVTVSSTGIATPSLDARLMARLPFRSDVERLPIFGLGCAGGVLGMARAAQLAIAQPGKTVLLLVVELCGLTFRCNDRSQGNMVATALFGDGAAAAAIRCEPGRSGVRIDAWGEHTWPDSLDVMGWRIEDDGFGVQFSRDIPAIVSQRLGSAVDGFLARHNISRGDLDGTICHPGGAKVIAALEEVFDLAPGAMIDARETLRDYGNVSAASILFVLDRALAAGRRGRHLALALGPGFSVGFLLLWLD